MAVNFPPNGQFGNQMVQPGMMQPAPPQPQMPPMGIPNTMPAPQPPFVGRYVNSLRDILPNEVPMDGRAAIFPNSDLSEIYFKSWAADGLIKTFRYVLDTSTDLNAPQAPQTDASFNQLSARIDELEKMVQKNARQRNSGKTEEAK